jgi:hypothetical protein
MTVTTHFASSSLAFFKNKTHAASDMIVCVQSLSWLGFYIVCHIYHFCTIVGMFQQNYFGKLNIS